MSLYAANKAPLYGVLAMDLESELPGLLPKAVEWAEQQQAHALENGQPLSEKMIDVARHVGVMAPESVRILAVDSLPRPGDPELSAAADATGLLGPEMIGLTLGYAVFIVAGHETTRLVSHECRHVYQYESNDGISGFLPMYLRQVARHGYRDAPMEIDARKYEVHSI